jgi:hypothetical protein
MATKRICRDCKYHLSGEFIPMCSHPKAMRHFKQNPVTGNTLAPIAGRCEELRKGLLASIVDLDSTVFRPRCGAGGSWFKPANQDPIAELIEEVEELSK